jgi:3-oxoacyl-[acyl-carrier protein] reductase
MQKHPWLSPLPDKSAERIAPMKESNLKFNFEGQTAIVTGGTRGIGRGVAMALLAAGSRVIVTYRSNESSAEDFITENEADADRLSIHRFDVSQYDETEEFFKTLEDAGEKFQILVHCAGIRADSIVGLMKADDWNSVIESNLTGTFNMCKLAVQKLSRQKYGRLIVITSPIGRIGFAGQANYSASKAGQEAFVRSLSKETASRKITVNCVSPGFIDTDFIADLPEEQKQAYMNMIPMKRFGSAEDVANCVLFLASREAS